MRWQPAAPIGQISSPWDGHLIHEEFSLTFEQVFFRNASGVSSYSFSITLLNSGIIRSPSSFKSKRTEAKINLSKVQSGLSKGTKVDGHEKVNGQKLPIQTSVQFNI